MRRLFITEPPRPRGRPRLVNLTDVQQQVLARLYLQTMNMRRAWGLYLETLEGRPHRWPERGGRPPATPPAAALETMRRARCTTSVSTFA